MSATQGWFARAERLLDGDRACAESGWYDLYRSSMLDAPPRLEEVSRTTIALAQHCRDHDLEAVALAFLGMAEVAQGRVIAGMRSLDEAMAMATSGEVVDAAAASEIFCVLLSVCEAAGDLARTEHWCAVAAAYAERHNCTFLAAYCRTTFGALLAAGGRWQGLRTSRWPSRCTYIAAKLRSGTCWRAK